MADRRVSVRIDAIADSFNRTLTAASAKTKAFASELESADSRMANLVQSGLALGPALVPMGAAAVPAIAGLTTQLGFAAAGAGVAALAFTGMGDALEALNAYQLEPTSENLAKLQESMAGLGPEAQEFVRYIDEITPRLQSLREAAQEGLLPGVQSGLDAMLLRLPQVRDIITEVAETSGALVEQTGQALAGAEWDEFFDFLEREAQPALEAFGQTVGNVFEGLANTWMGLDPLSDGFARGMLQWSESFAEATRNLDENAGFQEFIAYVQENGPRAVEALAAIGGAFVELVKAAAPVGAATLPIIQAVAEVLGAIAASPAGPVLIATAAGLSAISRAVALYKAANGTALMSLLGQVGTKGGEANRGARAAAAGFGVLALSLTDLDDKLGVANTAMGAALGSLGGPWGALAGGAAGAIVDLTGALTAFANENDAAATASAQFVATLDSQTGAITRASQAWTANAAASEGIFDNVDRLNDAAGRTVITYGEVTNAILSGGDAYQALDDKLHALTITYTGTLAGGQRAVPVHSAEADAALELGHAIATMTQDRKEDIAAKRDDIANSRQASSAVDQLAGAVRSETAALRANIAQHNRRNNILLAAQNAEIAWEQAIDDANAAVKQNGRTLDINTQKGRNNKQALLDLVAAWENQSQAVKNNERRHREAIDTIAAVAQQMGMNSREAERYARRLLDIPVNVETKVNLYAGQAFSDIAALEARLRAIRDEDVFINVRRIGPTTFGPRLESAEGNYFDSIPSYAMGDVRNGHQPEFAGPGPLRVWREPETGGESYIPHANDHRRPRAKAITERTANLFGGHVTWFGQGGMSGGSPSVSVAAPQVSLAGATIIARSEQLGDVVMEVVDDRIGDWRGHDASRGLAQSYAGAGEP